MNIVVKQIEDLKPAGYNPRQLSEKQYEEINDSLSEFGFVDPVIVNMHPKRRNIIVGGHQRILVWRDMGKTEVPAIEISLPLEKERELNIRLNKNLGSWDWDTLANEFDVSDLKDWGFTQNDLTGWGGKSGGGSSSGSDTERMGFELTADQRIEVTKAMEKAKEAGPFIETGNDSDKGNALHRIAKFYLQKAKK